MEVQGVRNMSFIKMLEIEKDRLSTLEFSEEISRQKSKVADQQKRVIEAKKIRQFEEESDALAAIVEREPLESETAENMKHLKTTSEELKKQELRMEAKFQQRKREYFSLVASAHQLNSLLNSDK